MGSYPVKVHNLSKIYILNKALYPEIAPNTFHSWLNNIIASFSHSRRAIVKALQDVSFNVRCGETLGILGLNGSGKSTLLKCMAGVLLPDEGEIYICDRDVVSDKEARKEVMFLGSSSWASLEVPLTVEQDLKLFSRFYGVKSSNQDIEKVLRYVGLLEYRGRNIYTLSSGMRRRALLARVFLVKKPVLLLDEPTVGLDPEASKSFRELLIEFTESEGITVLYATHYLYEAEALCDRVALLHEGRLIFIGSLKDLMNEVKASEEITLSIYGKEEDVKQISRNIDEFVLEYAITKLGSDEIMVEVKTYDSVTLIRMLFENLEGAPVFIKSLVVKRPSLQHLIEKLLGGSSYA